MVNPAALRPPPPKAGSFNVALNAARIFDVSIRPLAQNHHRVRRTQVALKNLDAFTASSERLPGLLRR